MKTSIAISCLLMGASFASLTPTITHAADDADVDRTHPSAFVKDSAITTKIKAKLAAEHLASLAHIHVDTDANGIVLLSGNADSQAEIDKAVAIAQGTDGVVSVKNDLKIREDA
jgi:hyperosmotically inducible periplasmic protein